jgi:hypothetical protein
LALIKQLTRRQTIWRGKLSEIVLFPNPLLRKLKIVTLP